MRSGLFTVALLLFSSSPSLAIPQPLSDALIERDNSALLDTRENDFFSEASDLWKRKGGGGGGGKGGGGSSGGSSSGSSSGSSGGKGGGSSGSGLVFSTFETLSVEENDLRKCKRKEIDGSSTSVEAGCGGDLELSWQGDDGIPLSLELRNPAARSGDLDDIQCQPLDILVGRRYVPHNIPSYHVGSNKPSSASGGRGSAASNTGGSTRQGSGPQPSYGGGKYYGGGAASPYNSGGRSPRGISPYYLGAGALVIFPGIWLYGAYAYPYHNPYSFHNRSGHRNRTLTRREVEIRQDDDTAGANETKTVQCLCAAHVECGCDDPEDTTFLDSLIGDGDYNKLNKSLVNVYDFENGTSIIAINGTLDNGTTIPGGDEDANGTGSGAMRMMVESSGYWVMVAIVGFTVFLV